MASKTTTLKYDIFVSGTISKSDEIELALEWLADNNPAGADLRVGNAVESAWRLLESLVCRLEPGKGASRLHRAVATKLISLGKEYLSLTTYLNALLWCGDSCNRSIPTIQSFRKILPTTR